MTNDPDNLSDRLWAHAHGQLPETDARALEAAAAADAGLRRRLDDIRTFDRRLRCAAADLALTDEALVDRALAAWDAEQAAAEPAAAVPVPRRALRFARLSPAWIGGLAAAAALLLVFVLPPNRSDARWPAPTFVACATRGGKPAARALTPATAQHCQSLLRLAVAQVQTAQGWKPRADRRVTFALYELAEGAFAVVVRAVDGNGRIVNEWSGDYSGLSAYEAQVPASAARLAPALSLPTAAPGGPP